jgi:Tfp pilus assembly protein PilV
MKTAPACLHQASPHSHRPASGMTLIEVCTGLFLFTIVAGGLLGSLIFARRMSIAALYESSALTSATGYMEQMKAIAFGTLAKSVKTESSPAPIPTITGTGAADPLTPSTDASTVTNTRVVDVFGHYNQTTPPAGAKDVLRMTYSVKITNLSAASYDDRLLIELNYTWDTGAIQGAGSSRSGILKLVRNSTTSTVN